MLSPEPRPPFQSNRSNVRESSLVAKRRRSRLLGWWYLSIGAGFFLLGLQRLLIGEALWLVVLRWLISAGFLALGYAQLRFAARAQQPRNRD